MRKEQHFPNKSSPNLAEDIQRQAANDAWETQNPEALRIILLKLDNKNAYLETGEIEGQKYAIVYEEGTKEKIFMTRESSEIAMLENPLAGLEFLGKISPLKFEDDDEADE